MFAQLLYPPHFFYWWLCIRLLSSLLIYPTFIIPLPSPLFNLEMLTFYGSMSLLKGDLSLPATHHIFTPSDLCRCVFLLAAHSPLLRRSCSNDACILSCIHTMYPHFWKSYSYLPTAADGDMGSLVLCMSLQSAKSHTDEKACHEFTCTCTVAPVAGCSWHLTKLLFCHTRSKVSTHNHKLQIFKVVFFFTFQADFFSQKYLGNFLGFI